MLAEVISIGDELVSGQRLDTNSQWLSQQLGDLGVQTIRHTTEGDDLQRNIEAFRQAAARADIVVCTGGLGPTLDDLTRQALSQAFDLPLELDAGSLRHIEGLFALRHRTMPEQNRVQAMFPAGSFPIHNPQGSAPGIDLVVDVSQFAGAAGKKCRFFALPGVPAEMKQMWSGTVATAIETMLGEHRGKLYYHCLKLFGIGESDVESVMPELIRRDRIPTVGITVSRATITLRIAGRAHSEDEFQTLIRPTVDDIHRSFGILVFGQGEDELQNTVLRQLARQKLSIATVEIGAASYIGDWLLQASGPGDSAFAVSLAFPTVERAIQWLHSKKTVARSIEQADASSAAEPWSQIATSAREYFDTDLALVVGPYPSTAEMESIRTFSVTWAIAHGEQVTTKQRDMGGHPDVLPARIAKTGLDLVRKHLG